MKRTHGAARQKLAIAWQRPTRFKAPIPKDEPERVASLSQCRILEMQRKICELRHELPASRSHVRQKAAGSRQAPRSSGGITRFRPGHS